MANTIITKNSATTTAVPTAGQLVQGELAVNVTDKRLFTENSGGTVVELGTNPSSVTLSSGTANGVTYLNGSKVLTSGSALTFDGTNLALPITASLNFINTNFGIGTPNSDGLQIYAATGETIRFGSRSSGTFSEQMRLTSTGLEVKGKLAVGYSDFTGLPANGAAFAGSVGIGTSSPAQKLHLSVTSGPVFEQITSGSNNVYLGWDSTKSVGTFQANTSLTFTTGSSFTERMRLDSSGNLGIGTDSPATTIDVNGGATNQVAIFRSSDAIASIGFADNTTPLTGNLSYVTIGANGSSMVFNTNLAEKMRLDSSGNLGLGVAPSASWSGTYAKAFQLGNKGAAIAGFTSSLSSLPYVNLSNNSYYASDANWKYYTANGAALYQQAEKEHRWLISSGSPVLDGTIPFNQAMTLDASGRLGIGETNPAQTLVLKNTASAPYVSFIAGSSSAMGVLMGTAGNTVDGQLLYSNSTQTMSFVTASAERVRIDSSGNFTIGAQTSTRLEVNLTENDKVELNAVDGTNTARNLVFSTGGSERARIDASGHLIVPNGITLGTAVGTYADANTLDDYEEGTWDFGLAGGTSAGTFSVAARQGSYVKVGRTVSISGYIWATSFTGTGDFLITGLPFAVASESLFSIQVNTTPWASLPSDSQHIAGITGSAFATKVGIRATSRLNGGTSTTAQCSGSGSVTFLRITGTYYTND